MYSPQELRFLIYLKLVKPNCEFGNLYPVFLEWFVYQMERICVRGLSGGVRCAPSFEAGPRITCATLDPLQKRSMMDDHDSLSRHLRSGSDVDKI
jgi:hypothetical protein